MDNNKIICWEKEFDKCFQHPLFDGVNCPTGDGSRDHREGIKSFIRSLLATKTGQPPLRELDKKEVESALWIKFPELQELTKPIAKYICATFTRLEVSNEVLGLNIYWMLRDCSAVMAKEEWTAKHIQNVEKEKAVFMADKLHHLLEGRG